MNLSQHSHATSDDAFGVRVVGQTWLVRRLLLGAILALGLLTIATIVWRQGYIDQGADEYTIYDTILKHVFLEQGYTHELMLIAEETVVPNDLNSAENQLELFSRFPTLEHTVLDDFLRTNDQPYLLQPRFEITQAYKLMSAAEQQELREATTGFDFWSRLRDRYPDSFGLIRFSRVAFNAEQNQAFVYVSHQVFGRSGWGTYMMLVKENGRWVIKGNALGYISERDLPRRTFA